MNAREERQKSPGWWLWLLLVVMVGCAKSSAWKPALQGITEKRQARSGQTIRQFESKRESAEFQAALSQFNQNDPAGCEQRLRRLLRRNPSHRDARLLLAEVYLAGNRFQEAVDQAQQALNAHPSDAKAQHTLALLLDASGQSSVAMAHYERAAQLEPENELYAASANRSSPPDSAAASSDGGDLAFCTTSADRADRTDSVNGVVAKRLPAPPCKPHHGRDAHATDVHAADAATKPDDRQSPVPAAVAALRANRPAVAIELLTTGENPPSGSPQVYCILGTAYYRQGDYQSSEVALRQALSLDNSNPLAYFLMGCTLAKLGQLESAEAHFNQARARNPKYAGRP